MVAAFLLGTGTRRGNKSSVILELVHLVIDVVKKRSDSPIFPLDEDLSPPQGGGAGWWQVRLGGGPSSQGRRLP